MEAGADVGITITWFLRSLADVGELQVGQKRLHSRCGYLLQLHHALTRFYTSLIFY